ncbi:MAG: deoxycytidylate deaminase [Mesorhizobium sp.]|nr:MAG: deoxycytidylate deaminase [Mesorhizobium sp.]
MVSTIKNPEIFIGLVGPIGVNLDLVIEQISTQLQIVGYESTVVKITDILRSPPFSIKVDDSSYTNRYLSLIAEADRVCKDYGSPDFLARLAIAQIREVRQKITGAYSTPAFGRAYIIRQLKREAEVELLKKVYGRKFILVSVFLNEKDRRETLVKRIAEYTATTSSDEDNDKEAIALMSRDAQEEKEVHGQEVSLIFHKGDVFVDGASKSAIEKTISRFIQAFFGHNGISPTRMEYGMYAAAGAALRSIDLSRQVGAAIFSPRGEIIAMGCNEVPKAFGGTYWADDGAQSHRDFEEGLDANQLHKTVIVRDLIDRLDEVGVLKKDKLKSLRKPNEFRAFVESEPIKASKAMDIIEFGRMIHAEMGAISDAARNGVAARDSILFVTTFPCHMCAKHIVAAGIKKVVFLEPYPKSYAKKLHSDSITFEPTEADKKVYFEPFLGISPRRYRDIFEKVKRKDKHGKPRNWYEIGPAPRIEDRSASYIEVEDGEVLPRDYLLRRKRGRRTRVRQSVA